MHQFRNLPSVSLGTASTAGCVEDFSSDDIGAECYPEIGVEKAKGGNLRPKQAAGSFVTE